jgi:hypothetical protein
LQHVCFAAGTIGILKKVLKKAWLNIPVFCHKAPTCEYYRIFLYYKLAVLQDERNLEKEKV